MFTWYDTHLRNLKAELQNNVLFSRHWAALFWACFIASALMVSSGVDQSLAEFFLNPDHVFIWQRFRDFTNVGLAEPYFALSLGAWLCGRYVPSFISSSPRAHANTLANISTVGKAFSREPDHIRNRRSCLKIPRWSSTTAQIDRTHTLCL